MSKHKHFRIMRAAFAAACAALLNLACGPMYLQSSIAGDARINDHLAMVHPARLSVRFGTDWLELGISNLGTEPVEVDWNTIQILEADMPTHHMREVSYPRNRIGPDSKRGNSIMHFSFERWHRNREPRYDESAPIQIAPATSAVALLYPVEHLQELEGHTLVGSLFCHSPKWHADGIHRVQLIIPIRYAGRAEVLRINIEVPGW
jgi:hypothetical protein